MTPSLEKLIAKQRDLAARIQKAKKKETSQAGEVARIRQRKLGRLVLLWMKRDQSVAAGILKQAKSEKWTPGDLLWLQSAFEGQK